MRRGKGPLVPSTVALVGLVTLAGCGGRAPSHREQAQGPAAQHVTITGNDSLRFAPMMVRLHTGTVRITLKDSGAYPHDLVIPALHVTSPTVTGAPGSTQVSFTITFTRPGRYAFHCRYHASVGMAGTFVVS